VQHKPHSTPDDHLTIISAETTPKTIKVYPIDSAPTIWHPPDIAHHDIVVTDQNGRRLVHQ
jgi:hypothetical protein